MMDVEYLITLCSEKEEFRGSKHFAKGNRRKGSDQGRMYFLLFRRTTVEKAMAPHSSTPAWKIPWTEEPGRLQSMESLRVRHNFTFTFMHWGRKWQHTPVFLPGESQGQGSLVGCRLWGRTELDTTEET